MIATMCTTADGAACTAADVAAAAAALEPIKGLIVQRDEPMSRHTSFGIGGPADLFVTATDVESLSEALAALHRLGIEPVFLGNGTNVLVRDGGIRGVVLTLGGQLQTVREQGGLIIAGAGASLAALCKFCAHGGHAGMGFAAGIPGSVGGAVFMNAGANGGEISDVLAWVRVVMLDGEVRTLSGADLQFGYRSSDFQKMRCAIAEVALACPPGEPAALHEALCETIQTRCGKQPVAQRSAGSIFKRPQGDYAGRLLEGAGAKGMRVGGAVVSAKHANFIVNEGSASAHDVLELIELVRRRVENRYGVRLETEIVVLGED